MKSDDCSRSTPDGKGLLKSDPSGRLAIFQLIKPLEKAHNGILSDVSQSVRFRDGMDEQNQIGRIPSFQGRIRGAAILRGRRAV